MDTSLFKITHYVLSGRKSWYLKY